MLRKLDLKSSYSSESDDLYQDFFAPALTASVMYKRAVGFFSLGVLLNAPAVMTQLVANGGKIELIFGKLVVPEDFEAIRRGLAEPWASEELPDFRTIIDERRGSLVEYRIRVLAWLFANEQLEMKIAIRPKGMFHQKIGILTDRIGDTISFGGSMNETTYALDPHFNSEEISVFRSWSEGQQEYVRNHQDCFERLWSGDTGSSTTICGVPEAIREGLNFVADSFPDQTSPNPTKKRSG